MENFMLKNDCTFNKFMLEYTHYNNEVKYGC